MLKELEQDSPLYYAHESWHTPQGRAIREVIFGANDGLITTVGFVSGLSGSQLVVANGSILLIAGLAEVIAGAISMAIGAYLSTKSQREFFEKEIATEMREIEENPQRERQEIREIYAARGFSPEEIEILVRRITVDKRQTLRFMVREELGLIPEAFDSPAKNGLLMGLSFVLGAFPPLLPYLFMPALRALPISLALAVLALFGFGVGKTYFTKKHWMTSGLEVVGLGGLAAGIGYLGGWAVSRLLAG
ncbi:MAG: VIT1/CCC1 transporter family protein [Candidatus Tectomicrobia bacterium]|uniref:VIT1/CCC1 transporter family protein n=1 Tax=Tectimicrobiota bacterium TaxID=2528274 RepID=A0A932CNU1_UNCTE|nr:VIT1/CCC1 transporter family protein [Candidatus Tectomicrobia bacterium]